MHKRTQFLLLCIQCTATISAQHDHKIAPPAIHTIRLNPTGLLDPAEPNLSVGYEYRFHESWAVATDLAWVFFSRYVSNTKHTNGIIFRSAIRRYIGPLKHTFLDAELHYKYVVSSIEDWLGRDCVNGVPTYEEFANFHYLRQAIGLNLKIGEQSKMFKNDKFWFEYYLGLGFRWNYEKVLNEHHCCYKYATNPVGTLNGDGRFTIAVPIGFRLLYRLN
jgi:hypothetical protein